MARSSIRDATSEAEASKKEVIPEKRKGTYRAREVERFDVARAVVELGGGSECVVAIDVAKTMAMSKPLPP